MNSHLERQASIIRRNFAVAIGAMAVCAALPSFGEPLPLGDVLACEMETYLVLDARDTLTGKWIPRNNAVAQAAFASAGVSELQIRLEPLSHSAESWQSRLEVTSRPDRTSAGVGVQSLSIAFGSHTSSPPKPPIWTCMKHGM